MDPLPENVTNDQLAQLPEAVRVYYKARPDGSGHDLWHGGVSRLKDSLDAKDRLLAQKDADIQRQTAALAELQRKIEGLDLDAAREALQKLESVEREKAKKEGNIEALLEAERNKSDGRIKKLEADLAAERAWTDSALIDRDMRQILTAGRVDGPDGKPREAPVVRKELLSGAEALLRRDFKPEVVREGETRTAMVTVNGVKRPMAAFLSEWLAEAKDYTSAPDNSGGAPVNGGQPRPGTGGGGGKPASVSRENAGLYLTAVASGDTVIQDG